MLRIANVTAVLSQLVCSQGAPHTALVVDARSGAVIASASTPSQPPFPAASLPHRGDEERAQMYAAVATSTWEDERGPPGVVGANGSRAGADQDQPLLLEAEVRPTRVELDQSIQLIQDLAAARPVLRHARRRVPAHPRRLRRLALVRPRQESSSSITLYTGYRLTGNTAPQVRLSATMLEPLATVA